MTRFSILRVMHCPIYDKAHPVNPRWRTMQSNSGSCIGGPQRVHRPRHALFRISPTVPRASSFAIQERDLGFIILCEIDRWRYRFAGVFSYERPDTRNGLDAIVNCVRLKFSSLPRIWEIWIEFGPYLGEMKEKAIRNLFWCIQSAKCTRIYFSTKVHCQRFCSVLIGAYFWSQYTEWFKVAGWQGWHHRHLTIKKSGDTLSI